MKKNDIYEITIEDMTEEGAGIGHIDGMAVFVKDTAVGDKAKIRIVKTKKTYCFGRLEELITPSPYREVPPCPVARQCGGCTLQHMTYEKELELKKDRVIGCIKRIGGVDNAEELFEGIHGLQERADGCYRYRNKMQFPIGIDKEGHIVTGFYAGRTHSIIPVDDCLIGHPVNSFITKAVISWAERYNVPAYDEKTCKGILRHVLTRIGFKTGELMVCMVINAKELPYSEELLSYLTKAVEDYGGNIKLTSVICNINRENTNRILGDKEYTIYGKSYIEDLIGDVRFRISAQSFYQVNPYMTEQLYDKALKYASLSGTEKVWDLYCGIGTISLFLAKKAGKVYGVEIVPEAVKDAKENASLNGIENAEFFTGKAEELAKELEERADVVVVDPPRKGCDAELINTIIDISPERLVYVSCDPATLARDIKLLKEGGFELMRFSVHDQFSRGMNVETVCLLKKYPMDTR
ncbi:MAG: 23S rRNA (uracil(1939)-C(5))-methyltransferase RlmD [Eubacterium sp.]|nr:23S rRNA (uracil(1939)-C(5))-methyltransferase RlmD [Eubacterium sp.]